MMPKSESLSETLLQLSARGYHITDKKIDEIPDQSLQSFDWRLDLVKQISEPNTAEKGSSTLVIAVSSAQKRLKLVFLEAVKSGAQYSPVKLLRKLFPQK